MSARAGPDQHRHAKNEPTANETNPNHLKRRVELALGADALVDTLAMPDEVVVMPLPESGRTHKIDRSALRKKLADSVRDIASKGGDGGGAMVGR